MIENYPIKESETYLKNVINNRFLLLYTLTFKNNTQSIKINKYLEKSTFSVRYNYPDSLGIEIEWEFVGEKKDSEMNCIELYQSILGSNQLFSIFDLLEKQKIKIKNAKIVSYSPEEPNKASFDSTKRFFMIMKSNQLVGRMNLNLLGAPYLHNLEQNVQQKSSLSDDFFEEIIQKNKNIKLFEKYLEEHDTKE